jgi:superfamily II DNA or RNA helicase
MHGSISPKVDEAIKLMRETANSEWVSENPLLPVVIDKLERAKVSCDNQQQSHRLLVDIQRDLSELNLLAHIFTRTKKKEVKTHTAIRRAFPIRVTLTELEKQFYDAVTDYVRELSESQSSSALIQSWILHMPQRRMASCIPAMVNYYRSRLAFEPNDRSEDDIVVETEQSILNEMNVESARQSLQNIVAQWPLNGTDSKYDAFIKKIWELKKEGPCKIIVFAFFKDTLRYLKERLTKDGIQSRLIYGDIPIRERLKEIEKYRHDQTEVLLSSRVGGEGLDLQFCDTLFNYDLPWNPMEVEQRIGRLDRIGQSSNIIRIFHFWMEGTIEQRILERLYERIKIFERSIGELEMILGEEIRNLERDLLSRKLTPVEEQKRIDDAARAIENRKAELERLEGESARFIGADHFFQEEVDMIRKRRRYVTGYQVHRFLEDFLKQECPRTILRYDASTNLGEIQPDQELRNFIQNTNIAPELPHFFGTGTRKIPITFDSHVAFENPNVEFLNVLHPLIHEITRYYAADKAQKIPSNAHFLILQTQQMPAGYYLYFIYKLKISAARERNVLESIFLNENLEPVAMAEDAEILLGEMVEKGEEPPILNTELGPDWGRKACQKARELLHQRIQQVKSEVERTNDAFIDRRLTSLKTFYDKNLDKVKALLSKGESLERQERYLRMLKGTINRLETEAQTKVEALERLRSVSIEYEDVAAGILQVR